MAHEVHTNIRYNKTFITNIAHNYSSR